MVSRRQKPPLPAKLPRPPPWEVVVLFVDHVFDFERRAVEPSKTMILVIVIVMLQSKQALVLGQSLREECKTSE
jgi:hypothetical protein